MYKPTLFLSMMLVSLQMASASSVTLPDNGIYYYWVRGSSGSVELPPKRTSGSAVISLPKIVSTGDTLYVLDPHTDGLAAVTITAATTTAVAIDQFHAPVSPAAAASPAVAIPTATPANPGSGSSTQSIVTFFLGLIVLGGVAWFGRMLYLSRGGVLIDAARKAGLDVPNPDDPIPGTVAAEGKYEPPPDPKVQRIPESAFSEAIVGLNYGYLITADGTSYALGHRPLTIGRDSDNDIILVDVSVSRKHATVEGTEQGLKISDQNSSNGVFVNGEMVLNAEVLPGARLSIGQVPLRYER